MLVSVMAASSGQVDMAAGNAVGSVTANTALILSLSILFLPSAAERPVILPKALILIGGILLLWLTSLGGSLNPIGSLTLALLFLYYIYDSIRGAKRELTGAPRRRSVTGFEIMKNILFFLVGAGGIILGSRLMVDNGAVIAREILHIDERIISLTMMAVGTSLPELVTAITAIVKRRGELTAGNILGANIIDILLILPLCSLTQGGVLPVEAGTIWVDLPVCLAAVVITLIPALITGRFRRAQGAAALLLYIGYLVILIF